MTYISQHKQSLQALECNMQMQCSEHGIKGFFKFNHIFCAIKKKNASIFHDSVISDSIVQICDAVNLQ